MTYSTKTVKELQELRKEFFDKSFKAIKTPKLQSDFETILDEVCEELKLRSEQQKEKLKNLCEQLAK